MRGFHRGYIFVIGCGGTGSYLCTHIGRLFGMHGDLRRMNHRQLVLVDADIVSESNITRQNFNYRDNREQKGLVLQRRLMQEQAVANVDFWASYANKRLLQKMLTKTGADPLVVVSCVDNHRTRNRIMSFLKPDPDSFVGARQDNWLYLDAGNNINDGWVSAMGMCNGESFGIDMRQFDTGLRNDNVDEAPVLDNNGREMVGCGAATSSGETYFANQQNSYLLASQLRSICMFGKGYGLLAYKRSDFNSDDWMTQSYENHYLAPFELS